MFNKILLVAIRGQKRKGIQIQLQYSSSQLVIQKWKDTHLTTFYFKYAQTCIKRDIYVTLLYSASQQMQVNLHPQQSFKKNIAHTLGRLQNIMCGVSCELSAWIKLMDIVP